jgi:hypothetical protein
MQWLNLLQSFLWFLHCIFIFHWHFFVYFFLVRFPLYYELKIAFVIWLLSPYTKGASLIYRKFLHPLLSSKERVSSINHFRTSFFRNVYRHMLLCYNISERTILWVKNPSFGLLNTISR